MLPIPSWSPLGLFKLKMVPYGNSEIPEGIRRPQSNRFLPQHIASCVYAEHSLVAHGIFESDAESNPSFAAVCLCAASCVKWARVLRLEFTVSHRISGFDIRIYRPIYSKPQKQGYERMRSRHTGCVFRPAGIVEICPKTHFKTSRSIAPVLGELSYEVPGDADPKSPDRSVIVLISHKWGRCT
jgi:hypothetical protein